MTAIQIVDSDSDFVQDTLNVATAIYETVRLD